MKTFLNTLALCLFAVTAISQQTPALHSNQINSVLSNRAATVTDTITYTELLSNTQVTDQYTAQGALFMGHDGSGNPLTYDYGIGSWGSIMTSDNWYNPIRMNFVDTIDSSFPAFAKKIEFDNPIDSEIDYISFKVYDVNDNLIHSYMSESPEHVMVEFDDYIASYVIFDDSLNTAYVVDNILLDISSEYVSVKEREQDIFEAYPNPSSGVFTLTAAAPIEQIRVANALGQTIEIIRPSTSNYALTLDQAGVYFVTVKTAQNTQTQRLVVE